MSVDEQFWIGRTITSPIGHAYRIEREAGAGGFGWTYRARRDDGTAVALKILRFDRMGEWKALELFEREAAALASLRHDGIPRHYELFVLDGEKTRPPSELDRCKGTPTLVLARGWVEGASLAARIERGERLSTERVTQLLRELLEILAYMHELHPPLVHRDINPANIVIDDDGRPHLVDFGAIQTRLTAGSRLGSTTIGTFGFMAPEQQLGRARPASDLYALAVTILVAMTHVSPEELPIDESTSKLDVHEAAPGLPAVVAATLSSMLEPAIGQRLGSAREALHRLDGKAASALVPAPGGALARPDRFGPLWLGAIAGGGLWAAVLYALFERGMSESTLVHFSYTWLLPIAFGTAGLVRTRHTRHPVAGALAWTGAAALVLLAFYELIWPLL